MAAILLDVDGVLHVSGEPLPGAARAVRRLRENGHRLRFVTNATTRARSQLGTELRAHGVDVADEEIQTAAVAAVNRLRGKRVLALTMHALVHDLEGLERVGAGADAGLIGGADETPEPGLGFSFMNRPARSSPASSTRRTSRRRCSASRARSTSLQRARPSMRTLS
jgi:hypothetical protein